MSLHLQTRCYLREAHEKPISSLEVTEAIRSILAHHLRVNGVASITKPSKVNVKPMKGAGGTKWCYVMNWRVNGPHYAAITMCRSLGAVSKLSVPGLKQEVSVYLSASLEM